MKTRIWTITLLITAVAWLAFAGDDIAAAEEELRAAETAFAKTMADRNLDGFASFLDAETVFSSPAGPLRGKKAVVDAWSAFYVGEKAPFSWQPEEVVVRASGGIGLSSGPVLDPDGNRVGTFNSVWIKGEDGWKILFDRGCPPCRCPDKKTP